MHVEAGDNATLSCRLKAGLPTPEVTWSRAKGAPWPAHSPTGEGPKTTLVKVTRHDTGVYWCTADNGFRATSRAQVKVFVKHKPHILEGGAFIQSSPRAVRLACTVSADPPAEVRWFRGGTLLSPPTYNPTRQTKQKIC